MAEPGATDAVTAGAGDVPVLAWYTATDWNWPDFWTERMMFVIFWPALVPFVAV